MRFGGDEPNRKRGLFIVVAREDTATQIWRLDSLPGFLALPLILLGNLIATNNKIDEATNLATSRSNRGEHRAQFHNIDSSCFRLIPKGYVKARDFDILIYGDGAIDSLGFGVDVTCFEDSVTGASFARDDEITNQRACFCASVVACSSKWFQKGVGLRAPQSVEKAYHD